MRNLILLLLFVTPLYGVDIKSSLLEMRKVSGVVYYDELPAPFSSFYVSSEDGKLHGSLNDELKKRYSSSLDNGVKVIDKTDTPAALKLGNELLQKLFKMERAECLAPLELLYSPLRRDGPSIGQISYGFADTAIYKKNPSSYLALVYLELSLMYIAEGNIEKASKLLSDACKALQIEEHKFPEDTLLRTKVSEENFGRPESAILYLRAQIALENFQPEEARRLTKLLIINNPSDPYTWQAVIEFGHLGNSESQLVERLLDAYPVVMGARHLTLDFHLFEGDKGPVSKEKFSAWLPGWIKEERKKIIQKKSFAAKQRRDSHLSEAEPKESSKFSKLIFLLIGLFLIITAIVMYRLKRKVSV